MAYAVSTDHALQLHIGFEDGSVGSKLYLISPTFPNLYCLAPSCTIKHPGCFEEVAAQIVTIYSVFFHKGLL